MLPTALHEFIEIDQSKHIMIANNNHSELPDYLKVSRKESAICLIGISQVDLWKRANNRKDGCCMNVCDSRISPIEWEHHEIINNQIPNAVQEIFLGRKAKDMNIASRENARLMIQLFIFKPSFIIDFNGIS